MNAFDILEAAGYVCDRRLGYCYHPEEGDLCKLKNIEPAYYSVRDRDETKTLKYGGYAKPVTHIIYHTMTGEWPANMVDHKDRNVYNIEWNNLRDATASQNCRNRQAQGRTTYANEGLAIGVQKIGRFFRVRICNQTLLWTEDKDEANGLALQTRKDLYGEFHPDAHN